MAGKMKLTLDFELTGEVRNVVQCPRNILELQVGPPNDKVFTMSVGVGGLTFSGTVSYLQILFCYSDIR